MYCVLEGTLVLADPQHGEVRVVRDGRAACCSAATRGTTASTPHPEPLRVLEFFAPPPSRGTASQYARHQPMLEEVHYRDARWSGRWPEARDERQEPPPASTSLRGRRAVGLRAASRRPTWPGRSRTPSTSLVTTGRVYAGHVEDPRKVEHESMLVVTAGEVWVDVQEEDGDGYATDCLLAGDAVFVPAHSTMRVLSRSSEPATYLMGSGRPVPPGWSP